MELRLIRYFIAVAEELHFGRAAERLRIAQPALSIQIKGLESSLGGKLFHREKRKVTLTDAGKLFLDEARATLAQAEKAEAMARLAMRGGIGKLEIGYSDEAAYSGILGDVLQRLKKECPAIFVSVHEMNPATQVMALKQRDIHAGFMTTLPVSLPDNFSSIPLQSWPLCAVLPAGHRLAARERVAVEDLRGEPFIVYAGSADDGTSLPRLVLGERPIIAHATNNALMATALVGACQGVALLPSLFSFSCETTQTVFRPLENSGLHMDCSFIWRSSEEEPLLDALHAALPVGRPSGL